MRRDARDELVLTAARYVFGEERAASLREAADRALKAGVYSDSLAQLATEFHAKSPLSDAGPVFERALAELGLPLPSRTDAVWIALRHAVGRIARGEVAPLAGLAEVKAIFDIAEFFDRSRAVVGDTHDLQRLLGAYWSYDELETWRDEPRFIGSFERDVAALDAAVVEEAQRWTARHGV